MNLRQAFFLSLIFVFWIASFFVDGTAIFAATGIFLAYWLFIILLLGWIISSLIPAWRKSKYHVKSKFMFLPLSIAIIGIVSLLLNVLSTPSALIENGSTSEQLAYMEKTDQQDRYAIIPFLLMPQRDINRVNRVLDLLADSEDNLSAEDKYNAALVLQHGSEPEHYEMAYQLASDANENGYENDLWMYAYDRWQISMGNEQVYDTQSEVTFSIGGIQNTVSD